MKSHTPTLLAVLALSVLLTGCGADAEAVVPAEDAVRVQVAEVTRQAQALPIRTSGRLAAKAEAGLSFKISGVVSRILVDEGQRVRAGQMLARLDLAEIDAQVAQARSAFDKAERDHARMARLYRDSVVTLTQLQDAETGRQTAEAALEMARFNRRYAVITAPADGRITRRTAEENELVNPGTPVLRMRVAGAGWVVRVGLADRDVVRLHPSDAAAVTFDAYPGRTFAGRVAEIGDAALPGTSTFEVEIQVDDPEGLLKSGFVGRVEIQPAEGDTYVRVPIEALVEGDGDAGVVYALDPATQRVRRMEVQVARILDDALALRGDLGGVTHVVTEGAPYLTEGTLVDIAE